MMRMRSWEEVQAGEDRDWFQPALDLIASLPGSAGGDTSAALHPGEPMLIGRAPGRLDVMGGIADYSGSVVLQMPLARSTYAILQGRRDGRIQATSLRRDAVHPVTIPLQSLLSEELQRPGQLADRMRAAGAAWAAYPLGIAQLCLRLSADAGATAAEQGGFALLIHSEVPEGKGVSSSAALEVATMSAICAFLGVAMDGAQMAAACQWVENYVVGAPCGIMDQLTSTLGRRDRLLRLRCQPAVVEDHLEVPEGFRFYGIDSGASHAVAGTAYATVRAATFMGYRIIAEAVGLPTNVDGDRIAVEDSRWGGYLANVTVEELRRLEAELPERMSGSEFLARYGGHTDPVTRVDAHRGYPVRQAVRHAVLENARVERFAELLATLEERPGAAGAMGRLMYESHESYGACGLGSPETDRLVSLVSEAGPQAGLFGARITGGGSGGTVAILGRRDAASTIRSIAARYSAEVGKPIETFEHSGPGAEVTGVVAVKGNRGWRIGNRE